MILENRRLARRTLLRGVGATLALPFLEIMKPAAASAATPAPKRLAFFYSPMGMVQEAWHPQGSGANFTLSPTLEPIAPLREKIAIFQHLDRTKVPGTDGHALASTCWLSSAQPDELSPEGYPLKRSLDQIIAHEVGNETAFRSLELSGNPYLDNKESVYFDNISWYGPGHFAPSMKEPQAVFDRMFNVEGGGHSSVLDLVMADARSLHGELGMTDARKLDEYMESVRTVERQIERVQARQEELESIKPDAPGASFVAMRRDEHIQLMGDLMILALQTDLTRVATYMVAPERWATPQMIEGVFDKPILHHIMSHEQLQPEVASELKKLDLFHVGQFAQLAQKMDAIQEGENSLLDNSLFVFGSALSNARIHVFNNLPMMIAGGKDMIQTNRLYRPSEGTPLANLWLTLANLMGAKRERFSDSVAPMNNILA